MLAPVKKYLLGRLNSLFAWIGVIGFVLELIVHRDPSTIMLCLFALLIVLPQGQLTTLFTTWTQWVHDLVSKRDAWADMQLLLIPAAILIGYALFRAIRWIAVRIGNAGVEISSFLGNLFDGVSDIDIDIGD